MTGSRGTGRVGLAELLESICGDRILRVSTGSVQGMVLYGLLLGRGVRR